MDMPKPPQKPTHLLDDLESIRQLLGDENLDLPLLTDSIDPDSIPLLSDIVTPPAPAHPPVVEAAPLAQAATLHSSIRQTLGRDSDMHRLDNELRAAAELILQDVIDDFVPQIEAELKRRLQARLSRLLPPRK
ncbi:DNA polymerase III subunit chi [Pseudomonas sp. SA3-5]|uniref:DNA polymerase III subunit chi n=1 Tax=Pseudomonas aestuarii TaxID=3018340 RepID=A0ABT4XB41_9PSED|nr:DNA polymerase III subunit chi [Pseudomonas aestuarii]MDA7085345.1 DNA polymerase III subunit chi [Pseudomonas aestuarii]